MAIFQKTNPVGIDKEIEKMQSKLNTKLSSWNLDAYGRIYKTEREGKTIPEHFSGGKDYKEVLINDKINGKFFFVENDRSTIISGPRYQTTVDIIFLLDLAKIKPNVTHRADEEARLEINEAIGRLTMFDLTEVTKGINALSDFDTDLIDMQPYHFLKFTGTLRYQINC